MDNKKEILIVLGFDMETDVGSWTPYYEGLKNGTPMIIDILSKKEAKATFYFTGEAALKHPEICKLTYESGNEIGCHGLYHETLGDEIFEIPGIKPLLKEEVKNRLKKATEIIEKSFSGKKVKSFRCPRLWGSTEVVKCLEELGYISDASYPLYFYLKQLIPYHPSYQDWLEKGDLKIVEIPNFADVTIETKDLFGRDRDQWPVFRTKNVKILMYHINNFINFVHERNLPAILCFYFHPWEFIEMPSKFHYGEGTVLPDKFITKNCGKYALKQLNELIDRLLVIDAKFLTAGELAINYKW